MNPTEIALWSLAVLLIIKIIIYVIYKKLSKQTVDVKDDAREEKRKGK